LSPFDRKVGRGLIFSGGENIQHSTSNNQHPIEKQPSNCVLIGCSMLDVPQIRNGKFKPLETWPEDSLNHAARGRKKHHPSGFGKKSNNFQIRPRENF
jgi:hypothetical protein